MNTRSIIGRRIVGVEQRRVTTTNEGRGERSVSDAKPIDMHRLVVNAYDCVLCQDTHYEGDGLYRPHIYHQSKHGLRRLKKPGVWTDKFTGYAEGEPTVSISIKYWTLDKQQHVLTGPTHGALFDQAERAGAVRIQDAHGIIYRAITGEWYSLGQQAITAEGSEP